MKYVTAEKIQEYIKSRPNMDLSDTALLACMVNFFAEGAVTTVSNIICKHYENDNYLTYGLVKGCRCGGCNEWQFVNEDTKEIVESCESLGKLVENHKNI